MNSLQEHPAPEAAAPGEGPGGQMPSAGSCGSAPDSRAYRDIAADQGEQARGANYSVRIGIGGAVISAQTNCTAAAPSLHTGIKRNADCI